MDAAAQEEALKLSRARREEEWQKIRNPDVITEKDKEEDFETKTLYERLQENRELKRLEIEEQFRYKNLVYSGLDNDEHKFLEAWENSKKNENEERTKMEIEELQKFKARMVDLDAVPLNQLAAPTASQSDKSHVSRQKQLLCGVVKKRKVMPKTKAASDSSSKSVSTTADAAPSSNPLAGLAAYSDSDNSDSDNSDKKRSKSSDSDSDNSDSSSGSSSSGSSSSTSSEGRKRVKKLKRSEEKGRTASSPVEPCSPVSPVSNVSGISNVAVASSPVSTLSGISNVAVASSPVSDAKATPSDTDD